MPTSGMSHHVAFVRTDIFLCSMHQLLITANVVPSSPILVTLMMEVLRSSETSVLTRATWHNIPEEGILLRIFGFPLEILVLNCIEYTAAEHRWKIWSFLSMGLKISLLRMLCHNMSTCWFAISSLTLNTLICSFCAVHPEFSWFCQLTS
jgi:hypothetical protein